VTIVTENATLQDLLRTLDPKTRDDLRRVLIRDQADRDAISELYGWPEAFVGKAGHDT
jgi:hypothetical protein